LRLVPPRLVPRIRHFPGGPRRALPFRAGDTENVLPTQARTIVDSQILAGETIEAVVARVKRTLAAGVPFYIQLIRNTEAL